MLNALVLLDPKWRDFVYPEAIQAELAPWVTFVAAPQSSDSVRANPSVLRDVEVIFGGWGLPRFDAEFLANVPRLRAVFYAAGAVSYFMTPEAWARPIVVCSAYKLNAVPVAEYALAAILFGLRRGWHYAALLRQRQDIWFQNEFPGSYGSTVALISIGAVGRLVREHLRPFDVRVIAYDPFLSPAQAEALAMEKVSLESAFERGDVVSVHTPLLPETHGLIRGMHFASMKSGATFINTARGAIVRESEMIAVLRRRSDVHAVLDVTDPEPPPAGSPLFDLPNVVLTPHIAGTGKTEAGRLGRAMIDEFHRWRQGLPLLHAVSAAHVTTSA